MVNAKTEIRKGLAVILAVLMCIAMVPVFGTVVDAATPGTYSYKIIAKVYDNLTMDATMNFTLYGTTVNGTGSEVEIASYRWDKNVSTDEDYTVMEGTTANGVFPTKIHITDDNVQYWAVCSLGYHLVLEVNGTAVNMNGTVNSSDVGNGKVDVGSGTEANFYVKTNSGVKRNKWDVTYNVTDRPAPTTIDMVAGCDMLTANAVGGGNAYSPDFSATVYDQFGAVWGATAVQWSVDSIPGTTVSMSNASGDKSKVVVTPFTADSATKDVTVVAKCSYGNALVLDNRNVTIRPTYHVAFDVNGGTKPTGFVASENVVNTRSTVSYVTYTIPTANQNPTRTGYDFYGWALSKDANSGEKTTLKLGYNGTYYAIWSPYVYYIAFNGNGSTGGTMKKQGFTYDLADSIKTNTFERKLTVSYSDGTELILPSATVTSDFLGWAKSEKGAVAYTDGQSVINLTNLPGGITIDLYAKWQDNSLTLPSPTKTGYSFGGWYTDKALTTKAGNGGDAYTPAESATLYAKWNCLHTTRTTSVVDEATCTKAGKKALVCTVCGDTQTETIPAIGHAYGSWIYSSTTNTHSRICANDATHVDTVACTFTSTITKAATCKAEGTTKYTCTVCGGSYTQPIEKLAHTPAAAVRENVVNATCTSAGSYDEVVYCSVCGTKISSTPVSVEQLSHTPVVIPAVEAKDCKTNGYTAGVKCSECGYIITAPVSLGYGNHIEETVKGYDSTCKVTGKTDGTKCSVCGVTVKAQEIIPVKAHTPADAVKENEKAPTCQADGSYNSVVYCSVCNTKLSTEKVVVPAGQHVPEEIPAVAAKDCVTEGFTAGTRCTLCGETITAPVSVGYGAHSYKTVNSKAASCTAKGYTGDTVCSICGDVSATGTEIPMTEHEFVTSPGIGSTCTTNGYSDAIVCVNCQYQKQGFEKLPLAPHTAGTVTTENEVAATCTTKASYEKVTYCKVCGAEMSRETIYTEYAPHTAGAVVTENEKAGTCTVKGTCEKVTYCTECGKEMSRTKVDTYYGEHIASSPVKENQSAATCLSTGVYEEVVYCAACHKELSRNVKTTPKADHKDNNGDAYCDHCGYDMSSNCSHMCHQGGFMGFIWKIVNIFNKLFKSNQYCSCGKAHW